MLIKRLASILVVAISNQNQQLATAFRPRMQTVSVVALCPPEKVWGIYRQQHWEQWYHDIKTMKPLDEAARFVAGAQLSIEMKDGKTHVATLRDVVENKCFTYTAPLPGSTMVATHTLEQVEGGGTRITHSFDFTGIVMGGLFRWLTRDYVENGLNTNTAALKAMSEAEVNSS